MIKSMTAYAEASVEKDRLRADVEIRAVNSRHLDVVVYSAREVTRFEEGLRKLAAGKVDRGRLEIRISLTDEAESAVRFDVDIPRTLAYFKALNQVKDAVGLELPLTLDHILAENKIILPGDDVMDQDAVREVVFSAVKNALEDLDAMRTREGEILARDLEGRLVFIEEKLSRVEVLAAAIPDMYKKRLEERIGRLTRGVEELDPVRLGQEAAILADKSDISEEIVRAHSHILQFREISAGPEAAGRKLNFLIQEFNREFNTMGSKAGKAELSHIIVDLKSELEKIREQVQNIE